MSHGGAAGRHMSSICLPWELILTKRPPTARSSTLSALQPRRASRHKRAGKLVDSPLLDPFLLREKDDNHNKNSGGCQVQLQSKLEDAVHAAARARDACHSRCRL